MRIWIFVLLAAAAALASAARAEDRWGGEYYLFSRLGKAVSLGPQPATDSPGISAGVAPAAAPCVSLLMDTREDGTVQVGDTFRVRLRTSTDAFVHLVDVGTDGQVTELYPRADRPAAVKRDETLVLDGTKDEEWKVQGNLGREWLLAYATTAPVQLPRELLTPAGADEAARVARLQKLKEQVKAVCRERHIDVGFQEREVDVVAARAGASASPAAAPGAGMAKSTYLPDRCYALCVGIDKYRHADEYLRDLKCAVADATAVRDKLVGAMKIPAGQVHTLTDENATLDGIRRELAWLAAQAGPGKCAYLFWSGHGTQAVAPGSGSGVTSSGLVAHDFSIQEYQDRGESKLLRDSDVGAWIDAFKGSGLVVVVDACYSGAITRELPARATLRPRGFFIPRKAGTKSVSWDRGRATPVNTRRPDTLVIEAAQFDQQAWEDAAAGHGNLTQRLLERWEQGAAVPILFQELQQWVQEKAKRDNVQQVPNLVNTVRDPGFVPFGSN